jgi:ABC-2 type transport system ATP-binding protein
MTDGHEDGALAVEVEGVVKRFGPVRALDGIGLRVRRGEVYGLLGPNGSGKTTLIRCLVGLVRPEAGLVRVLGRRMPDLAVLGQVGYMTQAAALYPDLSVEENVRFFAAITGGEGHVDEALRFVELEDRRHSVVATLSGGMRTRASLACAVVHRPRLLLLDEPTVGVDPQLRAQLWGRFRAMTAAGTTIVVSSHVMDEAERCDRLGLIRAGRLLAEGTVADLLAAAGTARLEDAFLRLSEEDDPPLPSPPPPPTPRNPHPTTAISRGPREGGRGLVR